MSVPISADVGPVFIFWTCGVGCGSSAIATTENEKESRKAENTANKTVKSILVRLLFITVQVLSLLTFGGNALLLLLRLLRISYL